MLSHLRTAWRAHRSNPGFTLVAILILGVGIGANTSVFSVANVALLKSLPYPEADRLMAVFEARPRERMDENVVSIADFLDWRDQNSGFSGVAAYEPGSYSFTGQGEPEQLFGSSVTAGFFDVLRVRPALGRGVTAADESPGSQRIALITHAFWQRRFGGDPNVIGRSIALNSLPHTIAGVLPAEFVPPARDSQVFVPMRFDASSRQARGNHNLFVIARLKPGFRLDQSRADMEIISKRLEAAYSVNRGHYANVIPLDQALRGKTRPGMAILLSAVGLVLLIACFNVANLLLARSVSRAREVSIRLALGASRGRIVKQLLVESLSLSIVSAAAGVVLALWGTAWLKTLVPEQLGIPLDQIRIDVPVLLFATGLAMLCGIVSGMVPALTAVRSSVSDVLRSGGRQQTASVWRQRQRAVIVAGEIALSVVLLAGAGLLIRSFVKLLDVNPGFRTEKLLTMGVNLPATYRDNDRKLEFQRQMLERVRRLPGVLQAGITSFLPVTDQDSRMGFVIENIDPEPNVPRRANWRLATPGYFETMQIPLLAGRLFNDRDAKDAPIVMLVNDSAVKRYWGGRNPIGTHARLSAMEKWAEVIGVVGDVKHWGLDEPARPEAYMPLAQVPFWMNNLVVRTQSDPMAIAAEVRRELWAIDRDLPPAAIRSMKDVIDRSVAPRRFFMLLLSVLAGIAILLAAAGIYAQLAYSVSRRMQELGLRMALGAGPSDVVALILRNGLTLAAIGTVTGVLAAIALTRLLAKLLFGVKPLDPLTLVAAPLILLAVALVACLVPSWRASKADPAVALRYE